MDKKKEEEDSPVVKKIKRLYQNYGIDLTDMEPEEFERIIDMYSKSKKSLDKDLKQSEIVASKTK